MKRKKSEGLSRRDVLKATGTVAAAGALAGVALPHVHAAADNYIRVALIGCGGRGTGAAVNALRNKVIPARLVAMADVYEDRLSSSLGSIKGEMEKQVDVPKERQFVGFDAYQKAMDCLKPGDVAIFATPPGFRWVHFGHAIDKNLNVFMEKPVTVDGPTSRKMFKQAEEATKKGLKVGVGLMCRHCKARQELAKRIKDGEMGDITMLRAYRQAGPTGSAACGPRPKDKSDLEFQIRNFHSFLWASGGAYSDFLIHNLDECCWMKDAWPVKAQGSGGRHYRGNSVDQNFDTYSVEYTFADGSKLFLEGRTIPGCHNEFASYAHGTKGSAVISTSSHWPAKSRMYKGQNLQARENQIWAFPQPEPEEINPYQLEWEDLMTAIKANAPYNEAKRGIEASLVTSMGRMAAHTGQIITYDQILSSDHEFAPGIATLTKDGPAPLMPDASGKYPIPEPGKKTRREY